MITYVTSMEEHWSSRQYYFLHPRERGIYRVQALLAGQAKVFRRTKHFLASIYAGCIPYTQSGNGHFLAYIPS